MPGERPDLAGYAAKSSMSRGQKYPEGLPDGRTLFERDRDRIMHCAAFRRLQYKTQVFVNHEGDYYRTRLTHSLEVSQIGKGVARLLGLNEELTETLALAHDLGHTPFGHSGEHVLDKLMQGYGGFEHNTQSYRVVTELEERYPGFPGLNLTWEAREGILKHSSRFDPSLYLDLEPSLVPTIEAQLINYADEIAYNNHDIDDGLESGLITLEQMAEAPLWAEVWSATCQAMPDAPEQVKRARTVSALISLLIQDLADNTGAKIKEYGIETLEDVWRVNKHLAGFSPEIGRKNTQLKRFLMQHLYLHPRVEQMHRESQHCISTLFGAYIGDLSLLPEKVQAKAEKLGAHRAVCDYIAGMTDRFAATKCQELSK